MPITKQAIKKLRHDRERSVQNANTRRSLASRVKAARRAPGAKSLTEAYRAIDKAAKHHLVHKNTAARLKSRLSKLLKK